MAITSDITIEKGRTGTIEVTVSGIDTWAGMLAKLCASEKLGDDPVINLTGTIESTNNLVIFTYNLESTKDLEAKRYYYEIIIYNASKEFINTTNNGILNLTEAILIDPTT